MKWRLSPKAFTLFVDLGDIWSEEDINSRGRYLPILERLMMSTITYVKINPIVAIFEFGSSPEECDSCYLGY